MCIRDSHQSVTVRKFTCSDAAATYWESVRGILLRIQLLCKLVIVKCNSHLLVELTSDYYTRGRLKFPTSSMSKQLKAKAKATDFCPQVVLEDEDSRRGPHSLLHGNDVCTARLLDLTLNKNVRSSRCKHSPQSSIVLRLVFPRTSTEITRHAEIFFSV